MAMTEEKVSFLSADEKLDHIKEKYKHHIRDQNSVYDLLINEWLVIMRNVFETIKDDNDQYVQSPVTINNESRADVFDPMYATFRATILQVCCIINVETLETKEIIWGEHCYNKNTGKSIPIQYKVGDYVEAACFDLNQNNIHSDGIYYYKSIERAFFQRNGIVKGFSGNLMQWYDSGRKWLEETYVDGKREGVWPQWNPYGVKCIEKQYLHGIKHGKWTYWYDNNKIAQTEEYEDGGHKYKFTSWNEFSGEKESEGMYVANEKNEFGDKKDGIWTYWDSYQNETREYYINGVKQNVRERCLQSEDVHITGEIPKYKIGEIITYTFD